VLLSSLSVDFYNRPLPVDSLLTVQTLAGQTQGRHLSVSSLRMFLSQALLFGTLKEIPSDGTSDTRNFTQHFMWRWCQALSINSYINYYVHES